MSEIKTYTIMVVDDIADNINVLSNLLRPFYKVKAATSGKKALSIASTSPPDLILLDVMMPEMDGYEVCRQLKQNIATQKIPVIFVTAKTEVEDETLGLEVGGVDYISKPIQPAIVLQRIKTHLALYDQAKHLAWLVHEKTRELQESRLEIIKILGRAAEYKDNETGMHVVRMSHYSRLLAQAADMPKDWTELLFTAAPMHDVGKIGIPDNVLGKPGKLDPDEWELMQQHVNFGVDIIGEQRAPLLKMAKTVAATHHEKWDGSGYPNGLAEEDIPIEGRIVALADVFDALTSERPYKKAWSVEQTMDLIVEQKGKHFDPTLVELFEKILPEILVIKQEFSEPEEN
ncbi:HD domain-containing phosphohydrolase [Marinomonas posidonica]|uniref:Response regulator receiver modulated metal dependent phosphohydrolase n=1 Tax=Marinomonas posidonica (strain CECT 7376 / NCIMB 14433 / IVIA-Po-181) TaxID=491952 RepID=F6D0X6_MARPP|nr:HD domain-containing phosphohydrolase [Marinomonas posidonica]AEF53699.1 response regulator receiver modulated metal dependent phosphohydrolase [Marinomonas posidonica IVIA-Po-181]